MPVRWERGGWQDVRLAHGGGEAHRQEGVLGGHIQEDVPGGDTAWGTVAGVDELVSADGRQAERHGTVVEVPVRSQGAVRTHTVCEGGAERARGTDSPDRVRPAGVLWGTAVLVPAVAQPLDVRREAVHPRDRQPAAWGARGLHGVGGRPNYRFPTPGRARGVRG